MASTLDCLSDAALKLQRVAGDATGKDLTLLVEESLEVLRVLVVDVVDAGLLEATVLLLVAGQLGQVAHLGSALVVCLLCHDMSVCLGYRIFTLPVPPQRESQ